MVEYDPSFLNKYQTHRPNSYWIMKDATTVDFLSEFKRVDFPNHIDYLQIDLEVTNRSTIQTLENLNNQVMDTYKFATVTFEHDIYVGDYFDTRKLSREIFARNGYKLIYSDIKNQNCPYEDWYIHNTLNVTLEPLGDVEYTEVIKRLTV